MYCYINSPLSFLPITLSMTHCLTLHLLASFFCITFITQTYVHSWAWIYTMLISVFVVCVWMASPFFRNQLIISYLTDARYPFLRNHLLPIVSCERVTPREFDLIFYFIVLIMHLYVFAPPSLKIDSFFTWEEKYRFLSPSSSSFLHIPSVSQIHS